MNNSTSTYLDTNTLQSDSRIRLPKAILTNLNVIPGETKFEIWFDAETKEIILKVSSPIQEIPTHNTETYHRG